MGNYMFFSMTNSAAASYVMFSLNSSHSESAGTVADGGYGSAFSNFGSGAETAGSVACSGTSSSGGGYACSGGSYSAVA